MFVWFGCLSQGRQADHGLGFKFWGMFKGLHPPFPDPQITYLSRARDDDCKGCCYNSYNDFVI